MGGENFDHLEEVLDNLQAFFDTLKGSTFYPPVGSVSPFAGAGAYAPPGWLLCHGSAGTAVTSSAFPDLYNVLTANGTVFPYGGSAGTTYTPDLRGRVPFGLNSANGDVDALSDNDGAAVADRSPKHKHSIGSLGISNTLSVNPAGGHSHTVRVTTSTGGVTDGTDKLVRSNAGLQDGGFGGPVNGVGDHSHTLAGSVSLTGSVGVGNGTNDAVPYVTVNYIIFVHYGFGLNPSIFVKVVLIV